MCSVGVMNKQQESSDLDNNSAFLVNKNGFPLDDVTWERMWDYAARNHIDGYTMVSKIRLAEHLDTIEVLQAPVKVAASVSIPQRLVLIQEYMKSLQYNHTGTQLFDIKKTRPISGLMEVAKDMVRESLPIKCLEALILGLYLTNDMEGVERFPISFKSTFSGSAHRHVVLGLYYAGSFGCLGMSRREDLMYKPLEYKTLTELIFEFVKKYANYFHEVKKVKIGLSVSHDPYSHECIQWKSLVLNLSKMSEYEASAELEKTARTIKSNVRNVWMSSPRKPYQSLRDSLRTSYGSQSREASPHKLLPKDRSPTKKKHKSKTKQSYEIRI